MSFEPFENTVLVDDWTVSCEKVPRPDDKPNAAKRIAKGWGNAKSDPSDRAIQRHRPEGWTPTR